MQLSLIHKNSEKTDYYVSVKGTDVYILNAIRRSVVSLTPTMAIDKIEFRKNSSIMYDEVMAHRLGLVPLKTDLKNYDMITKPEDEESLKCVCSLTLSVKGPKTVYSGDLKSSDPAIAPVFDNMPIVKLLKGQEVQFEAKAVLGVGRTHMKWAPGIVTYKHMPVVTIKNPDVAALKESLPEDSALEIKGDKVTVNEEKLYTTPYLDAFMDESVVEGVEVSKKDDEFILHAESFGQLSVKDMMVTGIDVLKEKLADLGSALKQ